MRVLGVAAFALQVAACGARTAEVSRPRPDTLRVEQLADGATYEFSYHASGPWAIHRLIIDPRACGIAFRSIKALDRRSGRETTSAMAKRAAIVSGRPLVAAVNADFFIFDPPGVSEGPQVSGGRLLKSEGTHREAIENRLVRLQPVVALSADRRIAVAHTRFTGLVRARNAAVPLGGVNVGARDDYATIFDMFWGDRTPDHTGVLELTMRSLRRQGFEQIGVVAGIDTSAAGVPIPDEGFVIALRGSARNALMQLARGDTVRWTASFDSLPANIVELVGGYPMLLRRGQPVHHAESGLRTTFADRRHPRVAIGTGKDRLLHIILVDGRNPGVSEGMTLEEIADYAARLGLTDVMNFDGGGSATLIVGNRIANRPADTAGERPVANALVVLGPDPGTRCR